MNDPIGEHYVDKIIGKCPHCEAGLRAVGGVKAGVSMICTNFKCQAGWNEL